MPPRSSFDPRNVRNLAVVAVVGGVFALTYSLFAGGDRSELREALGRPWYVDEAGRAFRYEPRLGEPAVTTSPFDASRAFPADVCSHAGTSHAAEPAAFLVPQPYLGKPGPTTCPTCARVVREAKVNQ